MRPLLVLLILLVPSASAFMSLPPGGSPHDTITRSGAEAADWPDAGMDVLLEAVRAPDFEEHDKKDASPNEKYRRAHHCDRLPEEGHEEAFRATRAYIVSNLDEAKRFEDAGAATRALGRALHALQDCFSHSNYPDLEEAGRDAFFRALVNGGDPPENLTLTAYDPEAEDPGMPDDPHPHDAFAKDSEDFNEESQQVVDGRSKYMIAAEGAMGATAATVAGFLGPLDDDDKETLARLGATEDLPGPHWILVGAMGILLLGRRRRPTVALPARTTTRTRPL